MKMYYTFGTSAGFPFRGGWVVVQAPTVHECHALFRAHYPDRTPGVLNCSDYYTENEFRRTTIAREGNFAARCHAVIRQGKYSA